jgi:hypothetical protein
MIRKPITLFALVISYCLTFSQSGLNCGNAISITPGSTCSYDPYMTGGGVELWFKFTANAEYFDIQLDGSSFSQNTPHAHSLELYSGSCGSLSKLAEDHLAYDNLDYQLSINLDAGALTNAVTYYLKVGREGHYRPCIQPACTADSSKDSANIEICIRKLQMLIPPDLYNEGPNHGSAFEENRGQLLDTDTTSVPEVEYYQNQANPAVYSGPGLVSMLFSRIDTATTDSLLRIDLELIGSNSEARLLRAEPTPGTSNYFLGHLPYGIVGNRAFSRLVYDKVYDGIDFHLYSNQVGPKFYFVVHPYADPNAIRIGFDGVSGISVDNLGGLEYSTDFGTVNIGKAHVYYLNSSSVPVLLAQSGDFFEEGTGEFGVTVESYPDGSPLVIMFDHGHYSFASAATNPDWGTLYGGSGNDNCIDMDTDENGNLYVAGTTTSQNFPVQGGQIYQGASIGFEDAFVGRFLPNYQRDWMSYYGSDLPDEGTGVVADPVSGRVYLCGQTVAGGANPLQTWSAGTGSFQESYSGVLQTGFLAGFRRADGFIEWATFFGGANAICNQVGVDSDGNLFVVGSTESTSVSQTCSPTGGAYQICNNLGGSFTQTAVGGGSKDGFIARFNPQTELEWSTLFGGNGTDNLLDLAIDHNLNLLYVGGYTTSLSNSGNVHTPTNCPSSATYLTLCQYSSAAIQSNLNGTNSSQSNADGLVMRFTTEGDLVWSSFFGGQDNDHITGVAVKPAQAGQSSTPLSDLWITGKTNTTFYGDVNCGVPTNNGFPQCSSGTQFSQTYGGGSSDFFAAQFNYITNRTFSSFLGGAGMEGAFTANFSPKVAVSTEGNAFICGYTESGSQSTSQLSLQGNSAFYEQFSHSDNSSAAPFSEVVVFGFDKGEHQIYSSYFGGWGDDKAGAVATYTDKVYIGGQTYSPLNFPYYDPSPGTSYFDNTGNGAIDAFFAQIQVDPLVGIDEQASRDLGQLSVQPNPTSGNVRLTWNTEAEEETKVAIFNLHGQVVFQTAVHAKSGSNEKTISLAELPSGLYIVVVTSATATRTSKLIRL